MGEQSWVKEGADCVCIREIWYGSFLGMPTVILDGAPKFMQQYVVKGIEWKASENDGHRIKIRIDDQMEFWCACGFRPLEHLPPEEEELTAPVVPEKKPEKVT